MATKAFDLFETLFEGKALTLVVADEAHGLHAEAASGSWFLGADDGVDAGDRIDNQVVEEVDSGCCAGLDANDGVAVATGDGVVFLDTLDVTGDGNLSVWFEHD